MLRVTPNRDYVAHDSPSHLHRCERRAQLPTQSNPNPSISRSTMLPNGSRRLRNVLAEFTEIMQRKLEEKSERTQKDSWKKGPRWRKHSPKPKKHSSDLRARNSRPIMVTFSKPQICVPIRGTHSALCG